MQLDTYINEAASTPTPHLIGAGFAHRILREDFHRDIAKALTDPTAALQGMRRARAAYLDAATSSRPTSASWYLSQASVCLSRYQTAADEAAYLLDRGISDAVWPRIAAAHFRAAQFLHAAQRILDNPVAAAADAPEHHDLAAILTDQYTRSAARRAADCFTLLPYAL